VAETAANTHAVIRVLVADDDATFAASLRRLIDRQPELTVVGIARDGLETLDLTEHLAPDAVVVDLHMPRLDGVSTVGRLRQAYPSLCLIVLTGDSDGALHAQAGAAGADGVLVKGEIIDRLVERLRGARPAERRAEAGPG
jgi:two-component system, NarL family, response regulator DesR